MAKLLFGAIVSQASNKLGGIVFSKNAYGGYAKKKTSPAATATAASAQSKNSFSASAKTWAATLTQPFRNDWITLANNNPVTDVFGNTQKLSGIAIFIRVNRELKLIHATQLQDAPGDQASFDIGGITPTFTVGPPYALKLTVTNNPSGADQLVVCASTFLSPGRKVPKSNKIAFVQYFTANHANLYDFTAAWSAKYIYLAPFGMIAVAAYPIRNTNGAAGPRYASLLVIT